MRVWVAGEEDVDAVVGLMTGFRDWMDYEEPGDETIRQVVETLVRDPDTDYLLAAAGEEAAGVCQLRYRLSVWTGADDCWLEDLYVRDDARGGGLGRALVGAAVERARARGCKRIELDASENDERAQGFYRSLGFTTEPKPPGRNLFLGRRLG
jgi:ribosomal protein S18 acetylase RimI-like enzyme